MEPCASAGGAPISSVTAVGEIADALLVFGEDALEEIEALLATGLRPAGEGLRAALTARSTSAAEPTAIFPATCSVAGFYVESIRSNGSTQ